MIFTVQRLLISPTKNEEFIAFLNISIEKQEFLILKELANRRKGYLMKYKSRNGFIFDTVEEAKEFCYEAVKILNGDDKSSYNLSLQQKDNSNISKPEVDKFLINIKNVIQKEGKNIITARRFINILDDLQSFNDNPSFKLILKTFISDGYANEFLEIYKDENKKDRFIYKFEKNTGFIKEKIEIIFNAISVGLKN